MCLVPASTDFARPGPRVCQHAAPARHGRVVTGRMTTPTSGMTPGTAKEDDERWEASMWSWLIIGGIVLTILVLLVLSGRTDNQSGPNMSG